VRPRPFRARIGHIAILSSVRAGIVNGQSLISTLFLVFAGAALLATVALYARQALLVAYILVGMLLGPSGAGLLSNPVLVEQLANVGIIFLLFLLGLNLHPQRLIEMLREATVTTLSSAFVFAAVAALFTIAFGFDLAESLVVGAAMMFSSTILGVKLLPTTVLHHRRAGGVMISILLLQDLLAILVLLALQGFGRGPVNASGMLALAVSLPLLIGFGVIAERYLLRRLFQRFDRFHEYLFLVSIGWCLSLAELAGALGLSPEIGSFIAGVAVATSPISLFIAESLKPLRDFFLVMFFVSLGGSFQLATIGDLLLPGLALATVMLVVKPVTFSALLRRFGEAAGLPWEIGVRLGQASEFSLLIAYMAADTGVIGARGAHLIQLSTLFTFVASAYWIVLRYPTPIAVSERLRRD
jgi:Kef-type K+ transport system membrane component KefB